MATKSCVVSGEASETDSEEDIEKHQVTKISPIVQGAIITGEDSESDLEQEKEEPAKETRKHIKKTTKNFNDSLLHRKLRETNIGAVRNLHQFWTNQTKEAHLTLTNGVEQHLLKSQLALQASLSALRMLTTHSNSIRNKLRDILVDTNYLDNLVINSETLQQQSK